MSEPGSIAFDAVGRMRGKSAELTLTARIPAGTHIESDRPPEEFLIPTVVEAEGLERATVEYPDPTRTSLGIPGALLLVYEGTVRFVVRGEPARGADRVRGTVRYQPCVGGACLPDSGLGGGARAPGKDGGERQPSGQRSEGGLKPWRTS